MCAWDVTSFSLLLVSGWTSPLLPAIDGVRALVWLLFISRILQESIAPAGIRALRVWGVGLAAALTGYLAIQGVWPGPAGVDRSVLALLGLCLLGLLALEQIYRNSDPNERPALRWLALAVGILFAYDLFVFSHAVLFRA